MTAHSVLVRNLVVAIFRANGAVIANGDRLVGDLDLSSSLWQVIDALYRSGRSLSVAEIAREMGLARQSVQRSTDILHGRALVEYSDNPSHKRAKLVALTAAGERALAAIHPREAQSIEHVLGQLRPAEIEQAARTLAIFADELTRQSQLGDDP